jgi:AcrR family transcriptional regulator
VTRPRNGLLYVIHCDTLSLDMSSMKTLSLSERLADHTQGLILAAAITLLEKAPVHEITVRAVAAHAHISERTIFRYFATRDALLNAIAGEVSRQMALPPDPISMAELLDYPDPLYRRFEATAALTKAALHTELFSRMRTVQAQRRWESVRKVIDAHAPQRNESDRKRAAANIRYFLSATAWHYYRVYFGFGLNDTIECARTAVLQAAEGLEYQGKASISNASGRR